MSFVFIQKKSLDLPYISVNLDKRVFLRFQSPVGVLSDGVDPATVIPVV
jgi:hypothetical protein